MFNEHMLRHRNHIWFLLDEIIELNINLEVVGELVILSFLISSSEAQ